MADRDPYNSDQARLIRRWVLEGNIEKIESAIARVDWQIHQATFEILDPLYRRRQELKQAISDARLWHPED
jgi:hypothetical protein